MTDFETTKLLSKPCPDCTNNSLILGVELMGGKAIQVQYQIYCADQDDCQFTHNPDWIDKVYTSKFDSFEDARKEAIERAYQDALKQFREDF